MMVTVKLSTILAVMRNGLKSVEISWTTGLYGLKFVELCPSVGWFSYLILYNWVVLLHTCPCSNTARWSSTVAKLVGAQSKPWPDMSKEMTGRSQPRVQSSPVRVFHVKIVTRRVRSYVTWRAQHPVRPSPPTRNQSTLTGRWHQRPVIAWPAFGQCF
jgi:hypothetical protein